MTAAGETPNQICKLAILHIIQLALTQPSREHY
jgi:hypothetical protein